MVGNIPNASQIVPKMRAIGPPSSSTVGIFLILFFCLAKYALGDLLHIRLALLPSSNFQVPIPEVEYRDYVDWSFFGCYVIRFKRDKRIW